MLWCGRKYLPRKLCDWHWHAESPLRFSEQVAANWLRCIGGTYLWRRTTQRTWSCLDSCETCSPLDGSHRCSKPKLIRGFKLIFLWRMRRRWRINRLLPWRLLRKSVTEGWDWDLGESMGPKYMTSFRVAGLGFGSELSRRLRRRLLAYDQAAFGMRGSRAHLNFPLLFRVSRAGHNEVRASVSVNG